MKNKGIFSIISICICLQFSILSKAQNTTSHFHLDAADGMIAEDVTCLTEDTTGIIWIGTTEGLLGYDGVGFEYYSTDNSGIPGNVFTDIWAEPKGNRLWLGLKSGLAVMDLRTRHIHTIHLNDDEFFNIADLSAAADGGLWILNIDYRFAHLDVKTDSLTVYTVDEFPGLPHRPIALQDLGNGLMLVYGENHRWRINLNSHKTEELELPKDWNLTEERRHLTDRHGNRWAGTSHGLDCETHIRNPFILLPMPDNGNTVLHSLMNTPSGILWTGYTDQLLLINADGTINRRITGKDWSGPAHFTPNVMELEDDGQVLFGMDWGGLWRFNPKTGIARQLCPDDTHLSIYALTRQPGRWLAGTSAGVYELRDGEDRLRAVDAINKAIPSHYIFGLQTDAQGKTWVGIYGSGIQVFDSQMRHIASLMPPEFPSGAINHLFRDSRNCIWAATFEGVACFNDTHYPESFNAYTLAEGLPSLLANAVGEDSDGRIWVTTNRGLARWDEISLQFCAYNQQKGLSHHPFSNAAMLCLPNGHMIVGGEGGGSVFDPNIIALPHPIPQLRLINFTLLTTGKTNETIATFIPNDSLTFSHRDNSFVLTFGLGDAALKGIVEYAYRIGHDGHWMSLGKEPRLTLHGLQPGKYTVEIRMRQMGQPWTGQAACIVSFRIRPPWWQTWWAYMSYAILTILIIGYTMYSWKRRLTLEHNLQYAEMTIKEMRKKSIPQETPIKTESTPKDEKKETLPKDEIEEKDAPDSNTFIDQLSRIILENIDNQALDIDFLTDRMAMSRSTLYRRIKSVLGMSANEYIRWVRLGEVARRIRGGDLNDNTIASIATDCGFNNIRYFRTCFKERYGVTPSEFGQD